jgi:hypothetical protein
MLTRLNNGLYRLEHKRQGKDDTPSLLCIDKSAKVAPFISEEKGFDGNKKVNAGRPEPPQETLNRRYVGTGLDWGVVVRAADVHWCSLARTGRAVFGLPAPDEKGTR